MSGNLNIVMNNKLALGIDIGGTNIVFGIVDDKGEIVFENSSPTKSYINPEAFIDHVYDTLNENLFLDKIIGIGIGAPNGNYFTGNIEYAPNLHWKGNIPLSSMFSKKFNKPCILNNDANIAAIGEMLFGVAKEMKHFVTITLGTGLGSGVVINGSVVYGEYGFAGEYGHVRVVKDGRSCGCGRKGCLETYASATGVVRSISELESQYKSSSKLVQLASPTSIDVAKASKEGDLFASEILDYTANILGNALADFMCFSNPQAYVLFGGLSKMGTSFSEKVEKYMNEAALNIYQNKTKVILSELQDKNAAVLGAAALVFHEH